MKVIAQTTTEIMLLDPVTREIISCDRPYVVTYTPFFEARTGKGEIRILTNGLPDGAIDEEFVNFLKDSDGDVELAVAAFVSTMKPEPEPTPALKSKAPPKPKSGN